jgi:hypothetical protein
MGKAAQNITIAPRRFVAVIVPNLLRQKDGERTNMAIKFSIEAMVRVNVFGLCNIAK